MSTYTIREMSARDDDSALEAWNEVFARGQGANPRTEAEWRWAYEENPAGRRAFVALAEDRVVALYAARPVRVDVEGVEQTFGQIVDSLVVPAHRAGLRRPGLFVEVGRGFFDSYGARRRDVAYFGWPVEAAWRAGERFLSYGMLRPELLLARDLGGIEDATPRADLPEREALPAGVEWIERFGDDAHELYTRCKGDWGASAIRDARWLEWRLRPRPGVSYRKLGVRDPQGALRGYAVQRTGAFPAEGTSVVVDWLVRPDDHEAARLLVEALVTLSRRDGALALTTLVPPWSDWFAWFQSQAFRVHRSPLVLSARSFGADHDLDWLRERFWYQWIDSDLV